MNIWYALVDLLPFEWAESGSMFFMKNALLGALFAGIAGLMLSYYIGSSAGASITLVLAVFFAVTFCFRKKRL